jgi:hypothetical protein
MKNEKKAANSGEPASRQAEKWGQKNFLSLSFCPHLFAFPGQDGAAFQGGQGRGRLRSITLNLTQKNKKLASGENRVYSPRNPENGLN